MLRIRKLLDENKRIQASLGDSGVSDGRNLYHQIRNNFFTLKMKYEYYVLPTSIYEGAKND